MPYPATILMMVVILAGTNTMAADPVPPDPRVERIVEELALRPSATAVRDNPDWRPRRVVVSLPPRLAQRMPELDGMLRRNTGDVELVVDSSDSMVPDAALLAGADAYIGVCTRSALENATSDLLWVHNYYAGMEQCAALPAELVEDRVFTNSKRLASPGSRQRTAIIAAENLRRYLEGGNLLNVVDMRAGY